jgi:hypothetical protein
MIKQDYIMLIMNCKKYAKKAKFQKMTWLPKVPSFLKYYHVIGDENLDTAFRFDEEDRLLWVKVEDDYVSLPKKVIRAFDAVMKTFEFQYIFKTDDDQILVNDKFFDIMKGITLKTPKTHYGGYIVDVTQNYLSEYHVIHPELPKYLPILKTRYCSGRFYYLSKAVTTLLLSKQFFIEKEYLEDYAIGFFMDEAYKREMINIATNRYFTDIENSDYMRLLEEGKI